MDKMDKRIWGLQRISQFLGKVLAAKGIKKDCLVKSEAPRPQGGASRK